MSSAFRGFSAQRGTAAFDLARMLSWLWGLEDPATEPSPELVSLGASDSGTELRAAVRDGVAGAAVLIRGERPATDDPASSPDRAHQGVANFSGTRIEGSFRLIDSPAGRFGVSSDLGTHAAWREGVLDLAVTDDLGWGTMRSFWALEAIERLVEVRRRLPAVGCLRLDDFPGTAQHQAEGREKDDRRQLRRLRALRRAARDGEAVFNLAIAAEAFEGEARVPLEHVWPLCVAGIAEAARAGEFEPVCHGLLHLDPDLWREGTVEFREFASLDREEAEARISAALAWQRATVGDPGTFVAPAWGYSSGTLEALAARGLPAWLPPRVGPLADGPNLRETLTSNLDGLHRLDLTPLVRLARLGAPPTVTFHGGLFDSRSSRPASVADAVDLVRLLVARDIERVPRVRGLRWIGAGEFAALVSAH